MNNFDIIIIGGGATGLGCAVEAASRGYKALLLEGNDYGSGTSSKSTKLVHGGIRYLANLDIELVKEGLEERYYFLQNAPHLARSQSYLIPFQNSFEKLQYWLGINLYDFLAGSRKLGTSKFLSKRKTLQEAPDLAAAQLRGGAIYYDGQFNDSRLLISLLKTFEQLGGIALNYHPVIRFHYTQDGKINGVTTQNSSGDEQHFSAPIIINATGTLCDQLMNLAEPQTTHHNVAAAQGTHLVFDKKVFDSQHAILIPKTRDGRVLFILPWLDKVVVGTTDVAVDKPSLEPIAQNQEIDFILETLNQYTARQVSRADIRSVFCGQRPLVKPAGAKNTAKISRKHEIIASKNGLISIVGGKWTIYRLMGEDTLNYVEKHFALKPTLSQTQELKLFGYTTALLHSPLSSYGSEAAVIEEIQNATANYELIHPLLPYFQAEIIYHIRHEQAKTIEDILARRTRALYLNAQAAVESAQVVANIFKTECNYSQEWVDTQIMAFKAFAASYCVTFYDKHKNK